MAFFRGLSGLIGEVLVLGMEMSWLGARAEGDPVPEATRQRAGFDRLFAVFGLGLGDPSDEPARRRGFEEEGGGALYPAGFRSLSSVPS
jgi:hypothetical protein